MKPKAEHILNMPGFFESMHSIIQVSWNSIPPLMNTGQLWFKKCILVMLTARENQNSECSYGQGMQKEKMRQRTKVHKSGELSALHEDIGTEVVFFDPYT